MRETVSLPALPSSSLLRGANLSMAAYARQSAPWKAQALGALCFSADTAESQSRVEWETPCLHVPMQRLDGGDSVCDVWRSASELKPGREGAIHYCHDGEVLFGVIALQESLFEAGPGNKDQNDRTPLPTPLHLAAESAYGQVFALLDQLRFPHVLRFWNYFADINADSHGLERYRQFNAGRQAAFVAFGRHERGVFPAACALGAGPGPLNVAFLSARVVPQNIENPRQISAYHYPQQYGPRSPMFSRASLVRLRREWVLFISGTASIIGHTTMHAADVTAQARETMVNIKAVLAEANRAAPLPGFTLADLFCKVYVRNPADLPAIRAELDHCAQGPLNAVYLRADVCRQELLLEIEACAALPLAPGNGPG